MILNRIQPAIDEHLRPNQNGFRPNKSTSSHILTLHRIIEGVKQNKLLEVITFVDFQKAFDSVHHAKMMKILSAYGIPDELVKAISLLYENTRERSCHPIEIPNYLTHYLVYCKVMLLLPTYLLLSFTIP